MRMGKVLDADSFDFVPPQFYFPGDRDLFIEY